MSSFQVSEEVVQVFNKLKNQRAHRFIVFKVLDGASGVDVEYAGARDETFEHFRNKMPANEPRYAVYDLEFTKADGVKSSKILFIMYSPDSCTQGQLRFIYSTNKDAIKNKVQPVHKELQINDHADLKEVDFIGFFI